MKAQKWYSRLAGALFLLAIAGGLSAAMLFDLNTSKNLAHDFASKQTLILQASIGLMVMDFACVGIAVAFYPILKEHHPGAAIGAVAFRGIESVFHLLILVTYILMSVAAQKFPAAEGNTVLEVMLESNKAFALVSTIAWGIGAMCYYCALFRSKLVPRFLSLWGLIAMPVAAAGAILVYYFKMDSSAPLAMALDMPIALQELVLGIWLIVKGVQVKPKESILYN